MKANLRYLSSYLTLWKKTFFIFHNLNFLMLAASFLLQQDSILAQYLHLEWYLFLCHSFPHFLLKDSKITKNIRLIFKALFALLFNFLLISKLVKWMIFQTFSFRFQPRNVVEDLKLILAERFWSKQWNQGLGIDNVSWHSKQLKSLFFQVQLYNVQQPPQANSQRVLKTYQQYQLVVEYHLGRSNHDV